MYIVFYPYLQVNHLTGLRSLGTLASVQHGYAVLLDLLLQVAQLALHLIAAADLVHELSLEGVHIRIELCKFKGKFFIIKRTRVLKYFQVNYVAAYDPENVKNTFNWAINMSCLTTLYLMMGSSLFMGFLYV